MPSTDKVMYDLPFPTGGWSVAAEEYVTEKDHLAVSQNVRVAAKSLKCGITAGAFASLPDIANGAFLFRTGSGDTASLASTSGGLFRYSPATPGWLDISGSLVATGVDTDTWTFADNFDWCYASNQRDGIWRYRGTGNFELFDAGVDAFWLLGFAGRLLCGSVRDSSGHFRDRVRWTGVGATSTFDAGGFVDLVDVQGPLTGLSKIGETAFAFKRDAIWRILETGLELPVFAFTLIDQGIGPVGGRTLANTSVGIVFLGPDYNVYNFDGRQRPIPIGVPVMDYIRANWNEDALERTYGINVQHADEYWLLLPTGSSDWPTVALIWNWRHNTWSKVDFSAGVSVGSFFNQNEPSDTWGSETLLDWNSESAKNWGDGLDAAEDRDLWLGRSASGATFLAHMDTTGTAEEDWLFETTDDPLTAPGYLKTITRYILNGTFPTTQDIRVRISTDGGDNWDSGTLVSVTGDAATQKVFFNIPRTTGENFRLEVFGTDVCTITNQQLEVFIREEIR